MGVGIGTLTPIIPTCTFRWKRRAESPLSVKMAVPFPYGLAQQSHIGTGVTPRPDPYLSRLSGEQFHEGDAKWW